MFSSKKALTCVLTGPGVPLFYYAGMEIAMETQREVRLILWCAEPVTNDAPRAIFPNIDTARNNIADFSHVKSHSGGRLRRVSLQSSHQNAPRRQSDSHVYFYLQLCSPEPRHGNLINLITLLRMQDEDFQTGSAMSSVAA